MNIVEIIEKKRDKHELSDEEIRFFISGVTDGTIPDYQISALLMAIYLNKLTDRETAVLTDAMAKSGEIMDLSFIDGVKVDKHSSGGVGDKTTLVVAPMVAACGLSVAKMSGRGLGYSGGTIDKLESIDGFNTALSEAEMFANVKKYGIAVSGQSKTLAPADKKLYALRDVTGTVSDISLIASSIMSKKLACNSDGIVLDVKCGSGAFMKTRDEAVALAEKMVSIGTANGKKTIAAVTNMDQPLGFAVGNALEVKEAINTLKGNSPEDFLELCLTIGGFMLKIGGKARSLDEARELLMKTIKSGEALEKFKVFIKAQGGDVRQIDNPELLPRAAYIKEMPAEKSGYIAAIDAEKVGRTAILLGAGRSKKDDIIDHSTGIVFKKKVGDRVSEGDAVCEIHASSESAFNEALKLLSESVEISEYAKKPQTLLAYIDGEGVHSA